MHACTFILSVSSQSGIFGRLGRNIHEHVFTNCHLESLKYRLVTLSPLLQAGEKESLQQISKNRDAEVVASYCSKLKPLPHEKQGNEFINIIICSRYSDYVTGWTTGIRFPAGVRDFSLLHNIHTGSGANPASNPMGTKGSIPAGKAAGG
jgi:hypothetical protein